MNKHKIFFLLITIITVFSFSCSVLNNPTKMKTYVLISTNQGDFIIGLYEGTPLYRDNFLNNASSGAYDSCLFYSVIPNGVMKAGLPASGEEEDFMQENFLQNALAPEINSKIINKTGAVGMLRLPNEQNPDCLSDTKLFYLVQGITLDEKTLKTLEAKRNAPVIADYLTVFLNKPENKIFKDSLDFYKLNEQKKEWSNLYSELTESVIPEIEKDGKQLFKLSKYQMNVYTTYGGVPVYDSQYTVFGEIVKGIDILQKFSEIKTGLFNKPKENVFILSTRKLTKKEYKKIK